MKKIEVVEKNVEELRLDFGNPRVISAEEYEALKESLKTFDDFGVIVINEDDQVIAGNQRVTVMRELRWTRPVLCKRLIGFSKTEQKAINIRANMSSGEFDGEILLEWLDEIKVADIDLQVVGFSELQISELSNFYEEETGINENEYTRKIVSPHYEPGEVKPTIDQLVDVGKTNELLTKIDAADIPDEEKYFLNKAAQRHLLFNYQKIADYYAHSSPAVQRLMEESALVIIDFKDAIEQGYVQLSDAINKVQENDEE